MDTSDRLAAYLAGDLSPADAAAVERDLARDAALRDELAAMQRADEALETLVSPQPSDGFEDRLRRHLAPVLAEQLGTDTGGQQAAAPGGTFDELAERRAARTPGARNRWVPALAGVAAAVAAVAVLTNLDLGGTQDTTDDVAADMDVADADDEAEPELFAEDADEAEMADDDAAAPPAPDGPTVVAADRDLDDADVEALLAAPELRDVAVQGFRDQEAVLMADRWTVALGAEPETPVAEEDAAEPDVADEPADDDVLTGLEQAPLRSTGDRPLTDEEEAVVARCLAYLTDEAPGSRIPAYAELGTYDGEPVVVFGFVSQDPDTEAYTRTEAWVVGQDDCEPRYWRQD